MTAATFATTTQIATLRELCARINNERTAKIEKAFALGHVPTNAIASALIAELQAQYRPIVHHELPEVGYYTVILSDGSHATLRFKSGKGNFADKVIIGLFVGKDNAMESAYKGFGVRNADGTYTTWQANAEKGRSVTNVNRVTEALAIMCAKGHTEAAQAFVLASGNCYCCNKLLTNPESIKKGIGPDCEKKGGLAIW
jgi:hypothetical protein